MPFAAALSEHPNLAEATGEVLGTVLEAIGPGPDLVLCFVTAAHRDGLGDVAAVLRAGLRPRRLLGATAAAVVGGSREVEDQPAIAVWAARLPSPSGPPDLPVLRLEALPAPGGPAVLGLDELDPTAVGTLVLLGEPLSFPIADVVAAVHERCPGVAVIGGLASAGFGRDDNRLVLDDVVAEGGAVAVLLPPPPTGPTLVVSQGAEAFGDPFTVTRSTGPVVHEIAGRPALDRLTAALVSLDADERARAERGLHLGRLVDEHAVDPARDDFVVRAVAGVDRDSGALRVEDLVPVGATVQFHRRDAVTAEEDLVALLAGRDAAAALVFTDTGRGVRLFGVPDHDAETVTALTGAAATAGMACTAEVGPVGGTGFVHGATVAVALFTDRDTGRSTAADTGTDPEV